MYNNHSQRRTSRPQRNGFSQRGRNNNSTARNFESNGPANFRVRGKPIQIHDKYVQLARDSAASGDKILTEDLLQHAEHYLRLHSNNSERSGEKNTENNQASEGSANERGQSSYSYTPRGHSRRRWAVAPEGKASEENSDANSENEEGQQAEVERRSSVPVGATHRNNFAEQGGGGTAPRDDDRDYTTEASYE